MPLGGSAVVTVAAMAMTVAVVAAMATREGAWPEGCEGVRRRSEGAQWGARLRTQAAAQCRDLVRWCFRMSQARGPSLPWCLRIGTDG